MGDHASPRGHQPHPQQLGADKRAHNAHAPHTRNAANKGHHSVPHALHHALDNDGHAVKRLGHRHHPQNRDPECDHLSVSGKQTHHVGREQETDLKANADFLNLQRNLNEIENKLSYARTSYNNAVTSFNNAVESVPSNIIAKIFNFEKKDLFQIESEKRENIKVNL